MIDVTCGIIHYGDKFLISQRSRIKQEYALFWELPGGKRDEGETIEDCMKRELHEELSIDVKFTGVVYEKKGFINKYDLYYCDCICLTDIKDIKHNEEIEKFAIVSKEELLNYNFILGDKEILRHYLSKI
tara:strand:- start:1039 stop:1428 length:390 start_codon:yes stop_codon:yes gene_type:complete